MKIGPLSSIVSTEYIDNSSRLEFECQYGHRWATSPEGIRHGTWCPKCAGKYKTIDDMIVLVNKKGGKCLSDQYLGAHTKLKWECAKRHTWAAKPNKIQQGSWCPFCARCKKTAIQRAL